MLEVLGSFLTLRQGLRQDAGRSCVLALQAQVEPCLITSQGICETKASFISPIKAS